MLKSNPGGILLLLLLLLLGLVVYALLPTRQKRRVRRSWLNDEYESESGETIAGDER